LCQAWNLAGFPAVTVPLGRHDGLPTAVQLIGHPGDDQLLLGLAGEVFDRP
jgi:Asp-tRNA(Asn)/Glu-tRNA(Gln) amidotransferase A subunit family amidase